MPTSDEQSSTSPATPPKRGYMEYLSRAEAPYIAMVVLAMIGIGYTDAAPVGSAWYWQVLAIVYGGLCVVTEWSRVAAKGLSKTRLVWTQILHWGAFLVAMRLAFLPVVRENMNSEVSGLILLYALALSTFLAGIYLNWRLIVVGMFLALGMVAIAHLNQATVLMVVLGIAVGVGFVLWDRFSPSS